MNCQICSGKSFKKIVESSDLKIYECNKCGLYMVPQRKKLKSKVDEYFKNYDIEKYISYYERFRKEIYKSNWKQIKKLKKAGVSLDFGSSFGWFLELAPKNWRAFGIEPADVARICQKKGMNVLQGTEDDIGKMRQTFDLITMWNVIEHLPEPLSTLKKLKKNMSSQSYFAIAFPNRYGFFNQCAYILYKISFGLITKPLYVLFQADNPVPHLYHYREEDIVRMLNLVGFDVVMVVPQKVIDAKNLWKRQEVHESLLLRFLVVPFVFLADQILDAIHFNKDELVVYAKRQVTDKSQEFSDKKKRGGK